MKKRRFLKPLERKALEKISLDHQKFYIGGELVGIGAMTLNELVGIGLLETGPSKQYGVTGWRITPDGWRCMYGKTYEEVMSAGGPTAVRPLGVWQWPR